MLNPALTMTYAQKQQRAADKRRLLLAFLASGEVYTTVQIAAELLQASPLTAWRLLQAMVAEKSLKVDEKPVPFSSLKIYGVTAHGIGITVSAHPRCREFFPGTTSPSYLAHHLEGQHIRIILERAGWTDYVPGKLLYVENGQRLKKLPDALATRPDGRRVAVEIERNVKSEKRMTDMVGGHLAQIVAGHYDLLYYFTPHEDALQRVFQKVENVVVDSEKVKLTDSHRARFKILDIQNPTPI
jgi:hypothetical protein